ncbi:hypothetical protein CDES_13390 [Corynebacterium deserti GIMN1.010]|uniref:Uncharacterized protein n=1 Tax=Corynebacterium deserti GIMN1.010 TaxID=931089 RepID=A0A0M5IJH1_9CORY|nr:MFS transporter [Corynebacterium deserti]ALC07011.1 hypothetical protein CDES_13390 [Corynebacterium deserti GIMN1.010]
MFCVNTFNFLTWAFITDLIDYQEVRTGHRDDATLYAIYSRARNLDQVFAGFFISGSLAWVGFDSAVAYHGLAHPGDAVNGVYFLANLVPGVVLIFISRALMLLYPLKKKRVEENGQILVGKEELSSAFPSCRNLQSTSASCRDFVRSDAEEDQPLDLPHLLSCDKILRGNIYR